MDVKNLARNMIASYIGRPKGPQDTRLVVWLWKGALSPDGYLALSVPYLFPLGRLQPSGIEWPINMINLHKAKIDTRDEVRLNSSVGSSEIRSWVPTLDGVADAGGNWLYPALGADDSGDGGAALKLSTLPLMRDLSFTRKQEPSTTS